MLTLYLVCLAVGAVLVGTSIVAGHDHDPSGADMDVAPSMEHDAGAAGHGHDPHPALPFLSFRFWTFAALFFGLTGLLLRELADTAEPAAGLVAGAMGALAGSGATWLVRRLRQPVGATAANDDWVGEVGELLHPLEPGGLSKVVLRGGKRPTRELLAVLPTARQALPRGARVIVLAIEDGHAVVELEPTSIERPVPSHQEEDA